MARTSLPPGFRFHPTDVELIKYYLKKKVMGKKLKFEAISELNIYKYSPWDLPDKSCLRSKDLEWYFFCPTERKYASGARSNRATESGYWKSTGKDRPVLYNEQSVGMIKTLVFHIGHAPKGERTNWVMYEYRSQDQESENAGVVQDAYVICKVFQKSGPGPKNGAQYGAPFNEEDWDDDETCTKSLTSVGLPSPALPGNTSVFVPGSRCSGHLSGPGPSNAMSSVHEVSPPVPDICEEIISMLDMFTEDSSLLPDQNGNNKVENFSHVENNSGLPCLDGNEICSGLGDLANMAELNGGGFNSCSHQTIGNGLNTIFACNDLGFLELCDLNNPLYFPTDYTGSGHLLANTLCEPSNNNDCLEQNYCPLYSFGSIQHDYTMNQSLLIPEESNGHGSHFHPFQKENGIGGIVNLGFTSTSWNANVTLCEQPEERSRHAAQADQDPNRERFCYLWG